MVGEAEEGSSEDRNPQQVHLTTLEILQRGLLAVGYNQNELDRVNLKKNVSRFRTKYGSHPRIYADLFERLQTTPIHEA